MNGEPDSQQVTLEMIWKQLQEQKTEAEKSKWVTPIVFASSIVVAGVVLMLPANDIGLFIYGVVLLIIMLCKYFWPFRKAK